MKRGEIWTASGGNNYAGKPRPSVILQDDRFETRESITICPITSDSAEAAFVRLVLAPDTLNGLRVESRIMVDKITTIPRARMGARIGRMSDQDMVRLNRAVLVFLGIAG